MLPPVVLFLLSPLELFPLTITVLVAVALFPAESSTVYVIVYVPALLVSTFPDIFILSVKSPSLLSVAVAPGSL